VTEELPVAEPAAASRDIAAEIALVRDSGLFDEAWYVARYPDVAVTGTDPIAHYLTIGAREGRDPNPLFQTSYYARQMQRRLLMTDAEG